jgi:hypothetical protein
MGTLKKWAVVIAQCAGDCNRAVILHAVGNAREREGRAPAMLIAAFVKNEGSSLI